MYCLLKKISVNLTQLGKKIDEGHSVDFDTVESKSINNSESFLLSFMTQRTNKTLLKHKPLLTFYIIGHHEPNKLVLLPLE